MADVAKSTRMTPEQTWAASHWLSFFNHRTRRQEAVRPD